MLENSSSAESEEIQSDYEDQDPVSSTSKETPPSRKRGRKSVVSPQLTAMLDRNGLSDRAAMMVVFEASRSLGYDAKSLSLNRSTIRRQRQKHRRETASSIIKEFKPNTALYNTLGWKVDA